MRRDVGVWPAAHIWRVREVEGLSHLAGPPLFEPNKSLALPLPARQLIKPDAAAVHGTPLIVSVNGWVVPPHAVVRHEPN
jgi:hypothetical protein